MYWYRNDVSEYKDDMQELLCAGWIQTLSIIFTVIAGGYAIHRDIKMEVKNQSARTDKLYEMFNSHNELFSARTDKLYEMFIDLLKERK